MDTRGQSESSYMSTGHNDINLARSVSLTPYPLIGRGRQRVTFKHTAYPQSS